MQRDLAAASSITIHHPYHVKLLFLAEHVEITDSEVCSRLLGASSRARWPA